MPLSGCCYTKVITLTSISIVPELPRHQARLGEGRGLHQHEQSGCNVLQTEKVWIFEKNIFLKLYSYLVIAHSSVSLRQVRRSLMQIHQLVGIQIGYKTC
jgi:hypothetical protein